MTKRRDRQYEKRMGKDSRIDNKDSVTKIAFFILSPINPQVKNYTRTSTYFFNNKLNLKMFLMSISQASVIYIFNRTDITYIQSAELYTDGCFESVFQCKFSCSSIFSKL